MCFSNDFFFLNKMRKSKVEISKKLTCLSSGSLKKCFKKDQNTVYLIPFHKTGIDDLQKEMTYLHYLKSHKIPVVQVRGKIEYQGREGIQEQMLIGNTLVKPHLPETILKVRDVPGIRDQIQKIRDLLEENHILVEDLQFMINKKDKLVIMDPLKVIHLNMPSTPMEKGEWVDVLDGSKSTRLFSKKRVDFIQQLEDLQRCIDLLEKNSTTTEATTKTRNTRKRKHTTTASTKKKTTLKRI